MAKKSKPVIKEDVILSSPEMESAIIKIDRRLADLEKYNTSDITSCHEPQTESLQTSLDILLRDIFGSNSTEYNKYYPTFADLYAGSFNIGGTPIPEIQAGYEEGRNRAIAILESIKKGFKEKLDDAGHSPALRPLKAYESLELHPEIDLHVGKLYLDGHYAEAVEKSVKVLNNLVRLRSNDDSDGTSLMQKVFSPKAPILKFNNLKDQSDKDEQQGFMFLFTGAVMGLRNPRAHKLITDDAERSLEFIAFVSLLAKLLDDAQLSK